MYLEPNFDTISTLLDHLPHSLLTSASPTHFPTQLPLSFPTPLHHVNLVVVLHLVHTTLSHPRHASYFASLPHSSDPHEITIRGVMGMFLASSEDWGPDNLLGSIAWKRGLLTEEKVAEYFGIQVMREQDHESLPGVRVGGRWQPGANIADALVKLFGALGRKAPGRCVGEAALGALSRAAERVKGRRGPSVGTEYASAFSDEVINFDSDLRDPYSPPNGTVIPSAPLRLLQDLAALLPRLTELNIQVPKFGDISNISPLPIPLPLIVFFGLVQVEEDEHSEDDTRTSTKAEAEILREALSKYSLDISSTLQAFSKRGTGTKQTSKGDQSATPAAAAAAPRTVELSARTYAALQTSSVEICRDIWGSARFAPVDKSAKEGEDGEWKQHMSMLDVQRAMWRLLDIMKEDGARLDITIDGS